MPPDTPIPAIPRASLAVVAVASAAHHQSGTEDEHDQHDEDFQDRHDDTKCDEPSSEQDRHARPRACRRRFRQRALAYGRRAHNRSSATTTTSRENTNKRVSGLEGAYPRRFRKPMLYPLSYEGARAQSSDLRVHPCWQGAVRVDLRWYGLSLDR
jgi:hypothetical protein